MRRLAEQALSLSVQVCRLQTGGASESPDKDRTPKDWHCFWVLLSEKQKQRKGFTHGLNMNRLAAE